MDYSNINSKEADMSDYNIDTDTQSSFDGLDNDDDESAKEQKLLAWLRSVDFFGSAVPSGGDRSRYADPKAGNNSERARQLAKKHVQGSREKAYAFWQVFEAVYGGYKRKGYTLELDAWSDQVHYECKATTRSKLIGKLEQALQMASPQASKGFYERQLDILLENRKFQPVRKYLESAYRDYSKTVDVPFVVTQKFIDDHKDCWTFDELKVGDISSTSETTVDLLPEWDNLGEVLFGTKDPLTQEMITTWLCGAVKRALDPGCPMKRSLILKGDQDAGKSAFARILAKSWGTELRAGTSEADIIRLCKTTWIMELSECDRLFKGKEASVLKSLLSTTKDTYIPKFKEADEASVTERVTLFIGTTNESKFLVDTTGNKRFWVIDMDDKHKLPLDWLTANVDQLWATAYHKLMFEGHPTDLSDSSQNASEVRNRDYMVEGSWVEQLERVLEAATKDGTKDIAFKVIDIQSAMGTHADNQGKNKTAVINSLKQLGYDQRAIKINGKTERVYTLKTAEKPVMAKFCADGWHTWSPKLDGWLAPHEANIEDRKVAKGQA